MLELVAVGRLLRPLAHRLEHVALDLDPLVARCRVMEGTQHVVDYFVHGHARVLPCVQDSAVFVFGPSACVSDSISNNNDNKTRWGVSENKIK